MNAEAFEGVTPFVCPLCGWSGALRQRGAGFAVWCTKTADCGIVGPSRPTQLEAIAVWNNRIPAPPLPQLGDKYPLVLYFANKADADEMVALVKEGFDNPVEVRLT